MAVYLSPGVYPVEIDLSVIPSAVGALTPAFIGTASKGPIQTPTYVSNAQQYLDTFGNPFPESYLGYAVLAYFDYGSSAWIERVGVECQLGQPEALSSICIDTSGQRGAGWGRIALFSGIDFGSICTRVISPSTPLIIQEAAVTNQTYNQIYTPVGQTPTQADLVFANPQGYTGPQNDSYVVLITSSVSASSGSLVEGATFEVTRNSDGAILLTDTITAGSTMSPISNPIDIGDGLIFQIQVLNNEPLQNNDTFTFAVQPNTQKFSFSVDQQGGSFAVNTYTLAAPATYTDPTSFANAISILPGFASEGYEAVPQDDGTCCFETKVAGQSIQLLGTEAFAINVGQAQYTYDIPRSFFCSTQTGPYSITNDNNRITIQIIGLSNVQLITFSIPNGLAVTPQALAQAITNGGIYQGQQYFKSYVLTVPGGEEQVFVETTEQYQYDQIQLMATQSYYPTLLFAETLVVLYPYGSNYQVYNDSRVILPESGIAQPNIPFSCEVSEFSAQCAADSAYYQNIVGWFVAVSPGTWITGYTLSLATTQSAGPNNNNVAGYYDITITDPNGNAVDSITNVSFDQTNPQYIANYINPGSVNGGTNGDAYINWIPRPGFLNNDPINNPLEYEVRLPGSVYNAPFIGGANGIPTDPTYSSELDSAIIGNPALSTGIYAFQNPEVYDITLLIIPGATSGAIIGQGLQMCESRGDCMMIIDPPFGLSAQQVVDWSNGMLFSDLQNAINSNYGALYFPWLEIYDQFQALNNTYSAGGANIFIPPSGHVSSVYANTANVAQTWFAPAGLNRGHLLTPIAVETDLTQGDRDLLYGNGNAVNPIVNFPNQGITVWGQRTLQREQSALDRVNVRMLLIYIKKNAVQFLRYFVFEPNDTITRAQVTNVSNSFLANIQALRGLYAYNVVCDETNNTPERIDQHELYVSYFLKPTITAEFIVLNLVILRTGASFSADEVLAAGGVVTNQAGQ